MGIFTQLIKNPGPKCKICNRKSDEGYFGFPWHTGTNFAEVYSLCKICFQNESAIAEAEDEQRRFTEIGVGIEGIVCYNGIRCACGCVTHARLQMCIQCSKNDRMLKMMQAEKRFIHKLLKDLKAEIQSKQKENQNAN